MIGVIPAVPGQSGARGLLVGAAVVPGGEWRGGRGEPEKMRRTLLGESFNGRRWKVDKEGKNRG